jgi:hypothetical protein
MLATGLARKERGTPFGTPQRERHKDLPQALALGIASGGGATSSPYNSSGNSLSSDSEKTGPSTHTHFGPTLQETQMPMPHFMRFSRVFQACRFGK